uniref:Uncharacterized protein n=1 Tax=Oryza nivara TaxID=4536 RepID=A0A0E0FMA2_ORYNI
MKDFVPLRDTCPFRRFANRLRPSLFTTPVNAPAPAKEHECCERGHAAWRASAVGTTRAWVGGLTPWLDERPKGYLFKRSSPLAGEFRKWVDWELPCYLTVIILGIRLNTKPNLTLPGRTRKGANRQQQQELLVSVEAQAERSAHLSY